MVATIKIGPLTRIEGHLDVEVDVDAAQGVVGAKCSGTMFRGFEAILKGRDPRDAPHLTQRICGVCPTTHGMASSLTLEAAFKVTPANNGRILRNLILGADFIQSHVMHFYHLALPDYVDLQGQLPLPPWKPQYVAPDMITGAAAATFAEHYVQALSIRRIAHQLGAIFGGKLPHAPSFVPGGCTAAVTAAKVSSCRTLLTQITDFIKRIYLADVAAVAQRFPNYSQIGRGSGNLLAYGVFDLDSAGTSKLLKRGRITDGKAASVDPAQITEYVKYSYYAPTDGNLNPSKGTTTPQPDKAGAYSWIKAPRYLQKAHETGPLARMRVNGDYGSGVSVMDRLMARALEANKIATAMDGWLTQLKAGQAVKTSAKVPGSGSGIGLTEAPRGATGHWMSIVSSKIDRYQIVTPTAWNASPTDDAGQRGPIEQALIGTPVANPAEPIEVLRVVHSFDPCLACSVHTLSLADGRRRKIAIS